MLKRYLTLYIQWMLGYRQQEAVVIYSETQEIRFCETPRNGSKVRIEYKPDSDLQDVKVYGKRLQGSIRQAIRNKVFVL